MNSATVLSLSVLLSVERREMMAATRVSAH